MEDISVTYERGVQIFAPHHGECEDWEKNMEEVERLAKEFAKDHGDGTNVVVFEEHKEITDGDSIVQKEKKHFFEPEASQPNIAKMRYITPSPPPPMESLPPYINEEKMCQILVDKDAWQQRRHRCFKKVDDVVKTLLEFHTFT